VIAVLAEIPYTTFPTIELGPLELRTFGFVVAIGVLTGAWLAARHGEGYGVQRDTTYAMAMRMVVAGVVGARLTWVLSHPDDIDSPIDVIAVWEGGLQFSGGFIAAIIVGFPVYRRWNRLTRWHSLDGYAYGLAIGLAIGRIACYSVGEHFGRRTSFFLAVRYEGGSVREPTLGDVPLREGMVFHHTALYELLYLLVLFAVLTWLLYLRKERPPAGVAIGLFCAWYGVARFASDSLRVNDERVLMMTGAQYFALALLAAAAWIFLRVRKQIDADVAAGMVPGIEDRSGAGPELVVAGGEGAALDDPDPTR
jgi:phosphatidylglycerol---prolipoprotein diacylglyceryl transferase